MLCHCRRQLYISSDARWNFNSICIIGSSVYTSSSGIVHPRIAAQQSVPGLHADNQRNDAGKI
jgi:hypothetical protein